jgi:hypothetical protein
MRSRPDGPAAPPSTAVGHKLIEPRTSAVGPSARFGARRRSAAGESGRHRARGRYHRRQRVRPPGADRRGAQWPRRWSMWMDPRRPVEARRAAGGDAARWSPIARGATSETTAGPASSALAPLRDASYVHVARRRGRWCTRGCPWRARGAARCRPPACPRGPAQRARTVPRRQRVASPPADDLDTARRVRSPWQRDPPGHARAARRHRRRDHRHAPARCGESASRRGSPCRSGRQPRPPAAGRAASRVRAPR